MASSSDPEQQMAAALSRQTPVAAAPAGGAGRVAPHRAAAAAVQRQRAAQRARATTDAFSAKVASARSLAEQNVSRREQLKGLKDELRGLQSKLREALTLQLRMESKRKAAATNEELRCRVADFRDKRDKVAAIISEELQALELLETKSNEDAGMDERLREVFLWYEKFLGFRVIGGEGHVKFVFNKIDPQCPEKEYWFRIIPSLEFIECDHHIKDLEEMAKGLDLNEHFFKFVRMAREKFQSSFMDDAFAAPLQSPTAMSSVNSPSEVTQNQTQSLRKNNVQLLPAKRGATALSGASPGVLRRSPRLEGMR